MNLLFDYDGTLHDTVKIYAPAFRSAFAYLVSNGFANERVFTDSEISRWTGYSAKDMWDTFMPSLPGDIKIHCSAIIGNEMARLLKHDCASLYPHVPELLTALKNEGHSLIFLSNCKHEYMLAHIKHFHLNSFFSAFYCGEDFGFLPKYEIFNTVMAEHPGDYIVIGDRFHDMEIAKRHSLKCIGCSYGYGESWELSGADITIPDFTCIPDALKYLILPR